MSASADTTITPPTSGGRARPGLGLALLVIASAQLMIVLDATIVTIALPHILVDLGFSEAGLQWVVTSYALALGSLLLLGGRLGDLFGRRRMFIIGVSVFAAASLLGGLAPNPTVMITARVIQGAAAALASPAALALINTTFPVGRPRNRAMAVYAAMSGAGAAIGLILGGALTEIDWRWTFFINVPIGLFVAFLAPRVLVESGRQDSRIDWAGAITATLGLFGIVFGLSHAAQRGASWGDALTLVPLIGGVLLLGVFVVVERRAVHPLLPLRIVTDRTRAVSLVSMALIGAGMFAMFYFLGLFIQQVMGYSPILAGVSFLPFTLGLGAAAGASQSLVRRVDPRWLSGTGALMAAFGMWGFTQLQIDSAYWSHLFPYTVVIGLGMGMVFIPLTMTATHGVQPADAGAAASALNTAQQVGGAVGIAALTTVFSHFAAKTATTLSGQAQHLVAQAMAAGHLPANPTPDQIAAVTKPVTDQIQTVGSVHGFWVAAGMLVAGAILLMTTLTVRHAELQSDTDQPVPVG